MTTNTISELNKSIDYVKTTQRDESRVIAKENKRYLNILSCLDAINAISKNRHNLDFDTVAKLFPLVKSAMQGKGSTYIRESRASPRKFYVDRKARSIVIVSGKHGLFESSNKERKIIDAVKIQLQHGRPPIARHVFWLSTRKDTPSLTDAEIELEKHFSTVLNVATYMRKNGTEAKALIIPAYDSSLAAILPRLSAADRLSVSSQLTKQIKTIHSMGFVHANIKPENVQVTRGSDGSIQARLAFFRHAYNPTSKKTYPKKPFLKYHYGTSYLTAPERSESSVSQLKDRRAQAEAEDRFALGCLMIELQNRATVFAEDKTAWSPERYVRLHCEIKGSPKSIDKGILEAAASLYRFTPHKRSSLDELCDQLQALNLE